MMARRYCGCALVFVLTLVASASAQQPLGSAFTYQGRLTDAGSPATGSYDFEMRLFDAATDGAQIGATVVVQDVAVAAGAFSVQLDFGTAPFGRERRWLQMAVRPGPSTSSFTALTPRQELTPTPTALVATRANAVADGVVGAAAIDPTAVQVRVTGQCAPGSSIRQVNADGSVVCQADGIGGGTVSAVTAGAGLTGGTITTAGTIGIAPGGITSTMVAAGAIGLAQIDQTQVQARVAASCPDGQFLRALAADGAPQCAPLPTPPKTGVVIAEEGRVGAIVRGPSETWIAHAAPDDWQPSVTRCLNAPCQGGVTAFSAADGYRTSRPHHLSLALTPSGLPMIAHNAIVPTVPRRFDLLLVRCLNAVCDQLDTDAIHDSDTNQPGLFSAAVTGADGVPVVLYSLHDGSFPTGYIGLRLARCTTTTCNDVQRISLNTLTQSRPEFALVVAGGVPVGAVIDENTVKSFSCLSVACTSVNSGTLTVGETSARHPSMAVGSSGFPFVAYGTDSGLKLARCTDTACAKSAAPIVLDPTATGAEVTSAIAIASDGRPTIAYLAGTSIHLVRCGNASCSSGNVKTTLDAARTYASDLDVTGVAVPSRPGLVLINDLPVVTYPDIASGYLKTASCSTATCS